MMTTSCKVGIFNHKDDLDVFRKHASSANRRMIHLNDLFGVQLYSTSIKFNCCHVSLSKFKA